MKENTIRMLYPDWVSGGLETYYFGGNLMLHILPENASQPVFFVPVAKPDGKNKTEKDGVFAQDDVIEGIKQAQAILEREKPDKVITVGGNCLVSLAPFDYLHGLYPDAGIIWIDAHPDVSEIKDGYPYAHAMVLRALLGKGDPFLKNQMKNTPFSAENVLYIGLQNLHSYQKSFLDTMKVPYVIQTDQFISQKSVLDFVKKHPVTLIHFDIDVLDPRLFHSTYFANPELTGDGSSGGNMSLDQLAQYLELISANADACGFTVAEYLPFDEYRLHQIFEKLPILTKENPDFK